MMGHSGTWVPAHGRAGDLDARLVNVRTGRTWRVPYVVGTAMPGCFSPDRRTAYVSGVDLDAGGLSLYAVHLQTGENTKLGGAALAAGITMGPVLSPDGKTIAVFNKQGGGNDLKHRVHLVDLASGDAVPIGEPVDAAFLNWPPDGKSLILVTRHAPDADKASIDTISRMNLDGHVTPIRRGGQPVIIGRGASRILFRGDGDGWRTCDLQGDDERALGDGMKNYGFPAPAPDGKRILWMKFGGAAGPRPVVTDADGGNPTPVEVEPGLWALPQWR